MKKIIIGILIIISGIYSMGGSSFKASSVSSQTLTYEGVKYDVVSKKSTSAVLRHNGKYKIFIFNNYYKTISVKNYVNNYRNLSMAQKPPMLFLDYRIILDMPSHYQWDCGRHGLSSVKLFSKGSMHCAESYSGKYTFFEESNVTDSKLINTLKSLRYQRCSEKQNTNNRRWNFMNMMKIGNSSIYDTRKFERVSGKIAKYAWNYIPCKFSSRKGNTCRIVRSLEKDSSFNWINLSALRMGERNFFNRDKNIKFPGEPTILNNCKRGIVSKCHLLGRSLYPELNLASLSWKLNYAVNRSFGYGKHMDWSRSNYYDNLIRNNNIKWYW